MKGGLNVFYMQVILISTFAIICVCVLIDSIYWYIKTPTSRVHDAKEDFDDKYHKKFYKSFSPLIVNRLKSLGEFDNHFDN